MPSANPPSVSLPIGGTALGAHHGWSLTNCTSPPSKVTWRNGLVTWSTLVDLGRPWSTLVDLGRPWSTMVDPGRPWSTFKAGSADRLAMSTAQLES